MQVMQDACREAGGRQCQEHIVEQLPAHALAADGVFYPSGSFRVLPPLPEDALTEGLRHRVLNYLCEEAGFDPELAQRMRQWQHSGFSVHNPIRVTAKDAEGRKQLARYMIRNPFALEKMPYDDRTGRQSSTAQSSMPA